MAIMRNIDGAEADSNMDSANKGMDMGSDTSRARAMSSQKRVKSGARGRGLIAVLFILVLALGALSAYFYQQLNIIKKNPDKVAQDQTNQVVAKVGKLMVLPEEQPTLATVSDLSALKGQPFFVNAKVGDIILIYFGAKKAVLYRESENKIIEVAPVSDIPPANSASNATTPETTKAPAKSTTVKASTTTTAAQ